VLPLQPFPPPQACRAATTEDTFLTFSFPAVQDKKVTATFDGGRISSDGGVMLGDPGAPDSKVSQI
jgi:hypothetical protein